MTALIFLLLVPQGCGSAAPATPLLQRFDALQPIFDQISSAAAAVRRDQSVLGVALRRENRVEIKRAAGVIATDAAALCTRTGNAGYTMRALRAETRPGIVRTYFDTILRALEDEWAEGNAILKAGQIIWADPLAIIPQDQTEFQSLQLAGRWYAWKAVGALAAAARWKLVHAGAFRYVPIRR